MNSLSSLASTVSRAFNSDTTSAAHKLVDAQNTLANRLAERLALPTEALVGKTRDDYSPAKVAERVLGFIDKRLQAEQAAGADSSKLQSLMQQARSGVEKGFAEAREILDGMGVLKGQVAEDIAATYDKIQDGFSDLVQRYTPSPGNADSVSLSLHSQRLSAQAQTFELAVTTRDGDHLHISIAQAAANRSQSSVALSSDGSTSTLQTTSQSASVQMGAWQVDIQGELDEQERGALEKLFSQVQDLADKFYAGDLNGAFDRAMALDLDGEQLASMSLALSQNTLRQATDTYTAVAQQGGQRASALNTTLLDYAQSLLDSLRSTEQVVAPSEAKSTLQQLLEGSFALDNRFSDASLSLAEQLNSRLLDGWQALLGAPQGRSTEQLA